MPPFSKKYTTVFFALALFFGALFAVVVPPFQSPDEYNHFFRAWQVSEGRFFPVKTTDARLGGEVPRSLDSLRRAFLFLKNDYSARTSAGQIGRHFSLPLHAGQRAFFDFPNTAIYAPTAYLPQAAAIFCLKRFEIPPLWMLYAGRLANLLAWAFLLRAALRRMPFQAFSMAFLALLPASLVMAASLNADVLSNGLCFWLAAWFADFLKGPSGHQNKFQAIRAAVAVAIVAANKLVFAPMALLFLGRGGRKIVWPILLAGAAAIFWANISGENFIPFDRYNPGFRDGQTLNEGVAPSGQMRFLLGNPLFFAKIAAKSYAEALPSTAAHLVGKFGWEKNYLPGGLMALLWLTMLVLVFSEKNPLGRMQRWLVLGVTVLCVALFSATMYALWCPVGSPILTNLQGRYFVPLLPLLCLALGGDGFFPEKWAGHKQYLPVVALAVLLLGNGAMLLAIVARYF